MILDLLLIITLGEGVPRFVFGDADFSETAAGSTGEVTDVVGDFHETACQGV